MTTQKHIIEYGDRDAVGSNGLIFISGCIVASLFAIPKLLLPLAPQETQASFISSDAAHLMFSTDQVLHGAMPYRDFFWHYGLTPLYAFAAFCKVFGPPSPATYGWHNQLWAILIAGFTLLLMARVGGLVFGTTAWFLTGLGWAFVEKNVNVYVYYERFLLLGVAFLWVPPQERRRWMCIVVGLLLGVLQTVKFGSAFLAGVSWVLIDTLWMVGSRCGYRFLGPWARQMILALVAFLFVETAIVAHAVATLGPSLAMDSVLPLYHVQWYRSYMEHVTVAERWPTWINAGLFLGYQLPQILGLAGLGTILFSMVSGKRSSPGKPLDTIKCWVPAAFLGVFFIVGVGFFFKHANNIFGYRWLIAPAVAVLLRASAYKPAGILFLIALLPSACLLPLNMWRDFRAVHLGPAHNLEAFQMPNGQKIWLDPDEGRAIVNVLHRLQEMQADASEAHQKGFFILSMGWMGSGLHYYGNLDLACRHSLFFPGVIRDFESAQVLDQLLRAHAVVVQLKPEQYARLVRLKPEDWKTILSDWSLFGEPTLMSKFLNCLSAPEVYPNRWLIFPVRRSPSHGSSNT